VLGRQPNASAAFTPGGIPGTHFQRLSRPQREPRKKSPVTPPGIDPGTAQLVAQRLNHYATPGPRKFDRTAVYPDKFYGCHYTQILHLGTPFCGARGITDFTLLRLKLM